MPSKPSWFHRLPEILDVLTHMDASHLDRQAVEKLFRVGPRRARQWMAGLPGIRAGALELIYSLKRSEWEPVRTRSRSSPSVR